MLDMEKVDEMILSLIKETPTLTNGYDLIEEYVREMDHTVDLRHFNKQLSTSYKQFENWFNQLLEKEKVQEGIQAFLYGLFEKEDGIQLYITGSTEWELDDDDWASNNDYFPEGRYPRITLYQDLYDFWEEKFYIGLFLTLSSTIIFANTYLIANPSKFPEEIVLATGFDDGDLYIFTRMKQGKITCFVN